MARPKYAQIRRECNRIKAYFAKGYDDETIRAKLGLTITQYKTRLKYIALDRFDRNRDVTLLQYEQRKQRRYDQLEALVETTRDERLKFQCIQEMGSIDESLITMGQRLGILPEAPKKFAGVFANVGASGDPNLRVSETVRGLVASAAEEQIKLLTGGGKVVAGKVKAVKRRRRRRRNVHESLPKLKRIRGAE